MAEAKVDRGRTHRQGPATEDESIYALVPVQLPGGKHSRAGLYQEWLDGTDSPVSRSPAYCVPGPRAAR